MKQNHLITKATRFVLSALLMLLGTATVKGQNSTFYIRKGNQITKVENVDPAKIKVTEWQVLLFKKGAPKKVGTQWGIIDGKSADAVMKKLKSSQDFEIRYNKWAGKGPVQDEVFTNFNPLGPVAVMENATSDREKQNQKDPATQEKWEKLKAIYDEVKGYYDGYQQTMEIMSGSDSQTPFDNVGNVFREYADNLKEAYLRVLDLQYKLQKINGYSMEEIDRNISLINANLSVVSRNAGILQEKLDIKPAANSTTTQTGAKRNDQDFDKLTEELTNAISNMDPNNPEAAYREVRRISKLLAKIISDDPDSDASMNKLGKLFYAMSETSDPDKQLEYLQEMTKLMEEAGK